MLKTSVYGLGFQHLPRDLANVNAWKTMFDPYINTANADYNAVTRKVIGKSPFLLVAGKILSAPDKKG